MRADRRVALGTIAFVVIGVIIIVGAAALAVELAATRAPPPSATIHGPVTATAIWIDPQGNHLTNATLRLGDRLKLSVTVTNGTIPIAVHMVYKGNVYRDHAWDLNATKYTYIIDSGPADTTDLGVYQAYAVVSFQDGTLARSNNVTLAVTR